MRKYDMKTTILKRLAVSAILILGASFLTACFGGGDDDTTNVTVPIEYQTDRQGAYFRNIPSFSLRMPDSLTAYSLVDHIYRTYRDEVDRIPDEETQSRTRRLPVITNMPRYIRDNICPARGTRDSIAQLEVVLENYERDSTKADFMQYAFGVWASLSFEFNHSQQYEVELPSGAVQIIDEPEYKDLCGK